MKQIKFISAILLIATMILGLNACSEEDKDKDKNNSLIVGKWKAITDDPVYSEDWVQFTSDMKFEFHHTDGYTEYGIEYGIYKIEDDIFYWMFSDEDDWITYEIKELTSIRFVIQEIYDGYTKTYIRMK